MPGYSRRTDQIHTHFLAKDLDLVERAYTFAKAHYTHTIHPIAKPFVEYALHVATLLTNPGANATTVAALLYPPPLIIKSALDDLEKEFKGENELIELVKKVLYTGHLEWNIWSNIPEQAEFAERGEPRASSRYLKSSSLPEARKASRESDQNVSWRSNPLSGPR